MRQSEITFIAMINKFTITHLQHSFIHSSLVTVCAWLQAFKLELFGALLEHVMYRCRTTPRVGLKDTPGHISIKKMKNLNTDTDLTDTGVRCTCYLLHADPVADDFVRSVGFSLRPLQVIGVVAALQDADGVRCVEVKFCDVRSCWGGFGEEKQKHQVTL